jgi:hypothetical protein
MAERACSGPWQRSVMRAASSCPGR